MAENFISIKGKLGVLKKMNKKVVRKWWTDVIN